MGRSTAFLPLPGGRADLQTGPMSIREWPIAERPREKLISRGAQALSEAELLALLIGSGVKGCSAVEMARALIEDFGSLRELLSADRGRWHQERHRLKRGKGIGPARFAAMQAALELARRHYCEPLRIGSALAAPEATRKFLLAQLRDRPYEVFCVV